VIVNDSDEPVFWSLEQPTGEMTRFAVQPCSSSSTSLDADQEWVVEWEDAFAITSGEVRPLDAPVTVIDLRFNADGTFDVAPPRRAAVQPDAPSSGFTCEDS
jgi:hypothetical protein